MIDLAYIDMGTGSLLFQALIAGFLGGLFFIKRYFAAIRNFFRKDDKEKDGADQDSE